MKDEQQSRSARGNYFVTIAVGLLLASVFASIAIGKMVSHRTTTISSSDLPTHSQGQPSTRVAILERRQLVFVDRQDGTVEIIDGDGGELVKAIPPGSGAFVRGVLRALARERRMLGIGPELPFALELNEHGDLWLSDSTTSQRLVLRAYGEENVAAFSALLRSSNKSNNRPVKTITGAGASLPLATISGG